MQPIITRLKDQLREELADLMLDALKEKGGIHLEESQFYRLKEDLMQNLTGRIRF